MKRFGLAAFAAAVLCGFSAFSASASTIYTLGAGNSSLPSGTYPSPYATVTVVLNDSTDATLTFAGATNATYSYLFGGAQAVDANFSGPVTISNITGDASVTYTNNAPQNVSDFGNMNVSIDAAGGNSNAFTPISFKATLTSGSWASETSVLTPDNKGFVLAAHIFVIQNSNGSNPTTGFAGNSGTPSVGATVPLPAAAWSGMALLGGMGIVSKIRRRSKQA